VTRLACWSAGFDEVADRIGVSHAGIGCGPADELAAGWPHGHVLVAGGCVIADEGDLADVDSEQVKLPGLRAPAQARDRFGIPIRLNFYAADELQAIVERGARILALDLTADGATEIAARARGTPRIAGRLLKRVRDFASVAGHTRIDARVADAALTRLEVDARGLDAFDRRYLSLIAESFGGGPVGIETIAAALGEARDAIEEIVEPYLLQQGLLQRTPRGRIVTCAAFAQLGLEPPTRDPAQLGLFVQEDVDGA